MKKKIIIIVITLLVLVVGGYLLWDKVIDKKEPEKTEEKENKREEKTETGKTTVDTEKSIITFYKGEEKVGEYKCKVDNDEGYGVECSSVLFSYTNYNSRVLILETDGVNSTYIGNYGGSSFIKDGVLDATGTVILYDIDTAKEIAKYVGVHGVKYVIEGLNLFEYPDNTYKFITPDGLIGGTYTKDELVFSCYEGCFIDSNYINSDNLLVFKKDGKYGVKKLTDDSTVVNAEYEDIRFLRTYDGKPKELPYFVVAKKDGLYNLYQKEDMKQITKDGYDKIIMVNDKVLLVYKDKYFKFKNLDETDYIEDSIFVESIEPFYPKNPDGVRCITIDNVVSIFIVEDVKQNIYHNYTLDLNTKELKKAE